MAVRGLLGGKLAMLRRMRAFVGANEMGRCVSMVAATAFASTSAALLSGTPLFPGTRVRMVEPFLLANIMSVVFTTMVGFQ